LVENGIYSSSPLLCQHYMLQSWGDWGHDLQILWWGFPENIIISYNVQEYEMKTLFKMVTFQN